MEKTSTRDGICLFLSRYPPRYISSPCQFLLVEYQQNAYSKGVLALLDDPVCSILQKLRGSFRTHRQILAIFHLCLL